MGNPSNLTRLEDQFRWWSFQQYYHRVYAEEKDLGRRFVLSLAASSKPVSAVAMKKWRHVRAEIDGMKSAGIDASLRLAYVGRAMHIGDRFQHGRRGDGEDEG